MATSPGLFDREWPSGFHYREDFITDVEERLFVQAIAEVAFADFEMRGVVARRRVAFFGQSYDRSTAGPLPPFLLPLRAKWPIGPASMLTRSAWPWINEYRSPARR